MAHKKPTQAQVKKLFRYVKSTGKFTWRVDGRRNKKGAIAGCGKSHGYRVVGVNSKQYPLQHIIWLYVTGKFPKNVINFKDQDRLNFKWNNLRDVTVGECNKNQPLKANSESGINGVFWKESRGKWNAQIRVDGKAIHLGSFNHIRDAEKARKEADIEYGFHKNHGKPKWRK